MRVHFIAIGGSAMHNLAIALHKKGYNVTGSDDEVFEPSKSRLKKYGLLPQKEGWDESCIDNSIDAIILGMHARENNPELIKAQQLGLKIYSYPEYLYEQTKEKIRVVIGGSHGKTTTTSMIMHVLKFHKHKFDYMVGAQVEGFDTMVELSNESKYAIFEGDEYLSSPIDKRPKFHLYKPHIAVITGIAWDHINVFPTYEGYLEQFRIFTELIEPGGKLFYFDDKEIKSVLNQSSYSGYQKMYSSHPYKIESGKNILISENKEIPIDVFGEHNMQNLSAAKKVCNSINISDKDFYDAIHSFKGAKKRLQLLNENSHSKVYLDFAHSPSKLKATVDAVRVNYPDKHLIAVMELHTFSSLNKSFLKEYSGSMNNADNALVYFNPETIKHKNLESISKDEIKKAFNNKNIVVYNNSDNLISDMLNTKIDNTIVLIMTSGNFSGVDINHLSEQLIS